MNTNFKITQVINRESAVEQGFYDGRFKSRVVSNKKKKQYLKYRKNKKISQYT